MNKSNLWFSFNLGLNIKIIFNNAVDSVLFEDSSLVKCDTVSLGENFPKFWRISWQSKTRIFSNTAENLTSHSAESIRFTLFGR